MLERFLKYIQDNRLFTENDKILLGVSGGIDSMVMLDLFIRSGFKIGVAHCNFKLRGEESDKDQQFVKEKAESYSVPFHTIQFDTKSYAEEKKLSVQMAARDLRFNWFRKIMADDNYQFIALAHHMDDLVETFFINLSRGTGIKGLSGIKSRNGDVIRPLLFATREEITEYSSGKCILFREDSSNNELKYTRNILRHKLIPGFQQLNPRFNLTMNENIGRISEAARLYFHRIEYLKQQLIRKENNTVYIEISELRTQNISAEVLYDILEEFQFNYEVVKEIYSTLSTQSGKQFYSHTHRLVKDRTRLYISAVNDEFQQEFRISEKDSYLSLPFMLKIKKQNYSDDFVIPRENNKIAVDKSKLSFPLVIRHWRKGDIFYPFGMKQKKKLSDFFIDNKFSILKKENTWLLCSGNDIVWIIGHRTDNRYRITNQTKELVIFEMNG